MATSHFAIQEAKRINPYSNNITNYPMTVLLESFVIIYIVIVVQVVKTLDL